jgi:uncharacterized protein (DUF1778 family)
MDFLGVIEMRRARPGRQGEQVTAQIPSSMHAKIEEAAAWRGVSVSKFLVDAAAKEADQVIQRERLLELTREDAELVLALLDSPPKPNAAMVKAVKAHQRLLRD